MLPPDRKPMRMFYDLARRRWRRLRARTVQTVPIFHIGRCGSTVLNKMLQKHPRIRADSEVYQVIYPKLRNKRPDLDPITFTRERIGQGARFAPFRGRYIFEMKFFSGLDLKLFPTGLAGYIDLMSDLGIGKAIVLRRRNLLRRVVSTQIAVKRGAFQRRSYDAAPVLPQITLELDRLWLGDAHDIVTLFDRIGDEYDQLFGWLDKRGIACTEIVYEDHIEQDPQVGYGRICAFMGLRPGRPEVPLARINTASLRDVLLNFDAVHERLAPTRHAWMLEDGAALPQHAPQRWIS